MGTTNPERKGNRLYNRDRTDKSVDRNNGQYPQVGDEDYPLSINGRLRCEANNRSGGRCKKYAMHGRPYCERHRKHMAVQLRARSRYHKYFISDETLSERFLDFFDDPDICDLRPELAIQRSVLAQFLELVSQGGDGKGLLDERIASGITELNKSVADLATKVAAIEAKGENSVSVGQLEFFVHAVADVVAEEVSDPATLDRVQRKLELLALPISERAAAIALLEGRGYNLDVHEDSEGSGSSGQNGHGAPGLQDGSGERGE
jgi:hypothetical protein